MAVKGIVGMGFVTEWCGLKCGGGCLEERGHDYVVEFGGDWDGCGGVNN